MAQLNNEGWYKDKDGKIRDKDGYEWFGHNVSSEANTLTVPDTKIVDEGKGAQKVMRIFHILKNPQTPNMSKEEIFNGNLEEIKKGLFVTGLTTDDNYSPTLYDKGNWIIAIVIAKPSGSAKYDYGSIKEGQGGFKKVGRHNVAIHKTDNISTLLNRKKK